jgi:hypothetical protein
MDGVESKQELGTNRGTGANDQIATGERRREPSL